MPSSSKRREDGGRTLRGGTKWENIWAVSKTTITTTTITVLILSRVFSKHVNHKIITKTSEPQQGVIFSILTVKKWLIDLRIDRNNKVNRECGCLKRYKLS